MAAKLRVILEQHFVVVETPVGAPLDGGGEAGHDPKYGSTSEQPLL